MEPAGLERLLREIFPDTHISHIEPLGVETTASRDSTAKGTGYGLPLRISLVHRDGRQEVVVFRTASANEFGHDRRSDRAQQLLLAHDTFNQVPRHVQTLDVGAIAGERLISVRDYEEFYLLTRFAPGRLYAEDLRRIGQTGQATPEDTRRCEALARYLVELHSLRVDSPIAYRRAVRDLVGHGEGIFGIVDGYPDSVPGASLERLQGIERHVLEWRWRLRGRDRRLRRTHGDFHPFNILFDERSELAILDASRGCMGEPADDVACMAINYVFFAMDQPASWKAGLGTLWKRFWDAYLAETGDRELLQVIAPFLTWRILVLASPRWYPALSRDARDKLLGFAEQALAARAFEPDAAERLFV